MAKSQSKQEFDVVEICQAGDAGRVLEERTAAGWMFHPPSALSVGSRVWLFFHRWSTVPVPDVPEPEVAGVPYSITDQSVGLDEKAIKKGWK